MRKILFLLLTAIFLIPNVSNSQYKQRTLQKEVPGAWKLHADRFFLPIQITVASEDTFVKAIEYKVAGSGVGDTITTYTIGYPDDRVYGFSTFPISFPVPYKCRIISAKLIMDVDNGDSIAVALYAARSPVQFADTVGLDLLRKFGIDTMFSDTVIAHGWNHGPTSIDSLCFGDTTYVDTIMTNIPILAKRDTLGPGESVFIGVFLGTDTALTNYRGWWQYAEPLRGFVELEILE